MTPRRLTVEHLARWRATYLAAQANFNRGAISEYDLMHILLDLNFKGHAIEAEINYLHRERAKWRTENALKV